MINILKLGRVYIVVNKSILFCNFDKENKFCLCLLLWFGINYK